MQCRRRLLWFLLCLERSPAGGQTVRRIMSGLSTHHSPECPSQVKGRGVFITSRWWKGQGIMKQSSSIFILSYSGTRDNCLRVITIVSDSSVPLKLSLPGWKYYCHTNVSPSHHPKSTLHWHKIHFCVFASPQVQRKCWQPQEGERQWPSRSHNPAMSNVRASGARTQTHDPAVGIASLMGEWKPSQPISRLL